MSLRPLKTTALCVVSVLGAACGGVSQSADPTTTRPPTVTSLKQVVTDGQLRFAVPSTWTVGHGVCRCGWGQPNTATLGNGVQEGGVACGCPLEGGDVSTGLHLYEGQGGLVQGGKPMTINGIRSLVGLDTSTATLTATFPTVNQWITISPAPAAGTATTNLQQVELEKLILATVKVVPGGTSTS
jgi:hypothetical protein